MRVTNGKNKQRKQFVRLFFLALVWYYNEVIYFKFCFLVFDTMTVTEKIEPGNRMIAFVAIAFGGIGLILICIGIGTPKWESTYVDIGSDSYALAYTANFFYTCSFTNSTFNSCTSRTGNLTNYPRYSSTLPWMTDYNLRMQNAAGLCVVGIVFLLAGLIMTGLMVFIKFETYKNLISPALLFLACLFMLAGLAEGSRYLLYNDYSANLYQAGHLFTILAFGISTFVSSRIYFLRVQEEEEELEKAKKLKQPTRK